MKNSIKIISSFILFLFISANIAAQVNIDEIPAEEEIDLKATTTDKEAKKPSFKERQYLTNGKTRISGFVASITEISKLKDETAIGVGGGAAIIFNQDFFFGGYGMGMTSTDLTLLEENTEEARTNIRAVFGQGGFWVGGSLFSKSLIHVSVSSKIGWGALVVAEHNQPNNDISIFDDEFEFGRELSRDFTFVATPEIGLEMNVAKWFKVNAAVGYRYAPGINNPYYGKDSLNGMTGSLNLMFGWFN